MDSNYSNVKLASLLLRIGLAAVFIYAAIDSFLSPTEWIGFFPLWMKGIVADNLLLGIFSVYEIILGLWLLWDRFAFYSAALSGLTVLGIIVFNLGAFDIVFRDVTMVFAAAALMALERK